MSKIRWMGWAAALLAFVLVVNCTRDYGRVAGGGVGAMTVGSVEPDTGSSAADTPVTVRGSGFRGTLEVLVGATSCTDVVPVTETLLTATIPAGLAAGSYDVTVISSTGDSAALPDAYSVIDPGEIAVTSISPTEGLDSEETPVAILGQSFLDGATALIGASALSQVVVVDTTTITATVPSGLTPGFYDVSVTNADGSSAILPEAFEVVSAEAVRIDSVSPTSGSNGEDVAVTITGANFVNPVQVLLGALDLSDPEPVFQSSTRIVATVPAGTTAGLYALTVMNPDEESDTLEDAYTVLEAGDDDSDDDADDDSDDDADDDTDDDADDDADDDTA